MKPFEEALIDAILEEYAEASPDTNGQPARYPDSHDPGSSDAEMERFSLWIDRTEKRIYQHSQPHMTQLFFKNQDHRNQCIHMLTQQGYLLQP